MKLLTEEIKARLPKRYSQEQVADPIVQVKFFCPWSAWTWYAYEGQEETFVHPDIGQEVVTWEFFGYVVGLDCELGYFTLWDLESVSGPGGLGIERDIHFQPTPLSVIRMKHER